MVCSRTVLPLMLAFGLLVPVSQAGAETVSASRSALPQHASLMLADPDGRVCWARYTANSGQARNGMLEEVAFRVPCPEQVTSEFLGTLQRALAARGYFEGTVTGRSDAETRAAVQAFQRDNGFNSPILTLETAQRLGLLPISISRN